MKARSRSTGCASDLLTILHRVKRTACLKGPTVKERIAMRKAWFGIKKNVFPQWDRGGHWRLHVRTLSGPTHGHCDREKKCIYIARVPEDPDERDLLLVHEICHALAGITESFGSGAWQEPPFKQRDSAANG